MMLVFPPTHSQSVTVASPTSPIPNVGLLKKENIANLQEALARSGTFVGATRSQTPQGDGREGSVEHLQPDISVSFVGVCVIIQL